MKGQRESTNQKKRKKKNTNKDIKNSPKFQSFKNAFEILSIFRERTLYFHLVETDQL